MVPYQEFMPGFLTRAVSTGRLAHDPLIFAYDSFCQHEDMKMAEQTL